MWKAEYCLPAQRRLLTNPQDMLICYVTEKKNFTNVIMFIDIKVGRLS